MNTIKPVVSPVISQLHNSNASAECDNVTFADLFDLADIQQLQDSLAAAFGVAAIITRPDGIPITRPSHFTRLCSDVILQTDAGKKNCEMLNPRPEMTATDKAAIRCAGCGRWEVSAGIYFDTKLLAIWRVGQARDPETTDEQLLEYAGKIGADIEEYRRHLSDVPVVSRDKLEKIAAALFETTRQLTRTAWQNFEFKRLSAQKEGEERLLHEKALMESQQRLELATNAAWLGLWDWHITTDELHTSSIWAEMLGYSQEQMDNSYPARIERFSHLLHPEDAKEIWPVVQDHISGKTLVYRTEFRMKTKAGAWKWILAVGNCIERDNEGRGTRMIGFHIDIDAHKKIEEALALAKDTAEAATDAKSEFLANMSHEIRTPMNAIIGMSQLALQTALSAQQRNYIEKVHLAAQNLLGIINDILDFSKIEAGKLSIEKIDFWLEDVFNYFANVTSLKAEEKGLDLIFDIAPDILTALIGDPLRLNQIIVNLGNNAVKFAETGAVIVGVEQTDINEDSVELHFWIKDSGIGMDLEQQKELFQPFSQVDNSASRKFGGSGLGLVISKKLVEKMHGKIWVHSEPDKGSTFNFTARFGRQKQHKQWQKSDLQELQGKLVLVIDDRQTSRDIIVFSLKFFGLVVETATDGNAGIKQFKHLAESGKKPDLVIVSSHMADISGSECALKIKLSRHGNTPVILMAKAGHSDRVLQDAERLGLTPLQILSTPIFPAILLNSIKVALGLTTATTALVKNSAIDMAAAAELLGGTRVLLVEDNEMNQELAMELLSRASIEVVLASNGQEALETLNRDSNFDGILMDCQMPVMDGYSATRAIRSNSSLHNIPIIAMTANAMVGDREKAIDAGMNDHIAKPVDVRDMFLTMSRWIKPATKVAKADMTAETIEQKSFTIPELAGIETRRALDALLNNTELYGKMLIRFYNNYGDLREAFLAAMQDADSTAATRFAHSLKGNAGNIGALSIQALAEQLEMACQNNTDPARVFSLLNETTTEVSKIRKELEKVSLEAAVHPAQPQKGVYDRSELDLLCKNLQNLLNESDSEAINLIEQQHELLEAAFSEVFAELAESVRNYDFEAALLLLKNALKKTADR